MALSLSLPFLPLSLLPLPTTALRHSLKNHPTVNAPPLGQTLLVIEWVGGDYARYTHRSPHVPGGTLASPLFVLISPVSLVPRSLRSLVTCFQTATHVPCLCPHWICTPRRTSLHIRFIPTVRNLRRIYLVDFKNYTSNRSIFFPSVQTSGFPHKLSF